jgi:hypothetical protein
MYSIVVEECAKGETSDPELLALQEVISEYMQLNILLHRENARTENKTYLENTPRVFCRILLIRQSTYT